MSTKKQKTKKQKTLQELEDEAGCFLAMPKERYEEFLKGKKK